MSLLVPWFPPLEQKRTEDMLRAIVRRLKILYLSCAAYEHHRLANRAADQLRMHSTKTLKDIGITNIAQLSGGMPAWREAGGPTVEKGRK